MTYGFSCGGIGLPGQVLKNKGTGAPEAMDSPGTPVQPEPPRFLSCHGTRIRRLLRGFRVMASFGICSGPMQTFQRLSYGLSDLGPTSGLLINKVGELPLKFKYS